MIKVIFNLLILINLLNGDFIRDNQKEVVIDTSTDLMWQDNVDVIGNANKKNWADAITYCENLNLGGYDNWSLPNFNQLYLLADRTKHNPAINSAFQNIENSDYWSSTTIVSDTSGAWLVDFSNGSDTMNSFGKLDPHFVRCVREEELIK